MPEILTKKYEKYLSFLLKLVYDSKRYTMYWGERYDF